MSAIRLDGKVVSSALRDQIAARVKDLRDQGQRAPSLHVVLCGDDPASATYVRLKGKAAESVGIEFTLHELPSSATTAEVVHLVQALNQDDSVDSMLVQLPLPRQVDADAVVVAVDPSKDADCLHPFNFGRLAQGNPPPAVPCTPAGCMALLRHYDIEIKGKRVVIIGRSNIVGRPLAALLTNADGTVTICHSRTVDLAARCQEADILVAAIGRPGMIAADFVKPGACVIDVGTTPMDGKVHGDVDTASVEPVAGWLSPVPGGVGPMTIAMVLQNTLALAEARRTLSRV